MIPFSFKTSGVTTSPSLKNLSKSLKLITAYFVSKRVFLKPLLGILLYKGDCPPWNHAEILTPLLAF